jgi:hypothetical protein
MLVLQACCDEDLTPMIGEWKGWRHCVVYRPGQMPKNDIIVLAQHLMQHGVVGKPRFASCSAMKQARTNEFKAFDYISAARSHFGMNRESLSVNDDRISDASVGENTLTRKASLAMSTMRSPMITWRRKRSD